MKTPFTSSLLGNVAKTHNTTVAKKFKFLDYCVIEIKVYIKSPKDGQNPESDDYINKTGKKKTKSCKTI